MIIRSQVNVFYRVALVGGTKATRSNTSKKLSARETHTLRNIWTIQKSINTLRKFLKGYNFG
jgi:hypothetical protein